MKRKWQNIKKGFTLIELLVVVAIIGILATIVMLNISSAKAKSRYARVLTDMEQIGKAVRLYVSKDNNIYPPNGTFNTTVTVLESYLPQWPTPPCDGYGYEYQNWNATGARNGGLIGIHFGKVVISPGILDAMHWPYYYNIYKFDTVTDLSKRGADISTLADKVITCKE